MTEDPVTPPAPEAGDSAAKPAAPRTMRPPPRKAAPPPSGGSNKVKAYLVIGIIVSTVILLPLVAWRVYVRFLKPKEEVPTRNVGREFNNAWDAARKAQDDLFKVQASVWNEGKELSAGDLDKVKAALATYEKTNEAFHNLNALMVEKKLTNSAEYVEIGEKLIVLKTWIWDANGVLDAASKPPKYGGLYIPMYSADKERERASQRMKEIREKTDEIIERKDPAEIEKTVKEVRELESRFVAIREELDRLDEELLKGLTLPDLKKEQLRELAELREFTSLANMSFREARDLRSRFPTPEMLAPKEEPPKQEPPKQEPPKQDPPKEEPPRQDPPKEDPPKETPK